jgi:hypothetical protein
MKKPSSFGEIGHLKEQLGIVFNLITERIVLAAVVHVDPIPEMNHDAM